MNHRPPRLAGRSVFALLLLTAATCVWSVQPAAATSPDVLSALPPSRPPKVEVVYLNGGVGAPVRVVPGRPKVMKPKSKVISAGGAVGNMKFPSVPADCLLEVWEGKNGIAISRFAPNGEAQLQQGYLSCTNAPAAVCTGGYVDTSGTYFSQFNGVCLPDPLFLVQVYNGVVNVTDPSGAVHQMLAGQAISCDPTDCQAGIFCASFTHRQVVEFQAEALALGAKEPPLKPTCPSGTTSSTTTTSLSGTTTSSSTSTSNTYPGG
jgi:hypothetical protein